MSDVSFQPADTAAEGGGRDRKTVLVAGGLAAVVLAGAGYFFMGSGGGEEEDFSVPVRRGVTAQAATTAPAVKPAPARLPDKGSVVGRNPFKPLIVEAAATGGGAQPGGDATTGTGSTPTAPTAPTAPTGPVTTPTDPVVVPTTPATPTKPATPVVTPTGTVYIQMNYGSVLENRAGFDVGTRAGADDVVTHKVVRPGDTFGKYFKLQSITYDAGRNGRACARLAFGETALNICSSDSRVLVL